MSGLLREFRCDAVRYDTIRYDLRDAESWCVCEGLTVRGWRQTICVRTLRVIDQQERWSSIAAGGRSCRGGSSSWTRSGS